MAGPAPVIDCRRFLRAGAAGTLAAAGLPIPALAESPRRGGTLKCIGLEPVSFDVHASPAEGTALVSSLVRRTLFKLAAGHGGSSDSALVPDLALKVDMSRDGRIYTIALRPGVRWEDKELAADQVHYLFPPAPRQVSSWAPWVRQYEPRSSLDRGAQLESVWLSRRP